MTDSRPPRASLKVSAVARRTGVSVRALHYYEEIGLLAPSGRTASGHRLYTPSDLHRLQQIRTLQQLGMSLAEVQSHLAGDRLDAVAIVRDHRLRVAEQRRTLELLEAQLQRLERALESGRHGDAQTTETLLETLEQLSMYDAHFTPEQLRVIHERAQGGAVVSPAIAQLEAARERGVPPTSAEAQRLFERFREAVDAVSGGDAALAETIYGLLHAEPKAREDHGISEPLFAYMTSVAVGLGHLDPR